jgi:hypothetical protein
MPEKRAPKKMANETTPKKRVAVTVRATKKKLSPRSSARSTSAKIAPKRNPTATQPKDKNKRPSTTPDEVVTLPTRVSATARLRERMLRMELDEHLQKAMYRIAYTAGLCFILVGSAYALVPQYTSVEWQAAAVISSNEDTTTHNDSQSTTIENTETGTNTIAHEPSELTMLTTVPDVVTETLEVYFEVTNALGVVANLKVAGSNNSFSLPVEQITNIKYRVTIKPELYNPDYYKLFLYVRPLDGSATYVTTTQEFHIGQLQQTEQMYGPSEFTFLTTIPENVVEKTTVYFQATNAEKVSARLILVGTTVFLDIPHTKLSNDKYRTVIEPTRVQSGYYKLQVLVKPLDGSQSYVRSTLQFLIGSVQAEDSYNDQSKTVNETEDSSLQTENTILEKENLQTTKDEPGSVIAVVEPTFEFLVPAQRILTDTATLQLLAPSTVSTIELYARQTNSLSARYVTTAFKRNDAWVFVFDSKNLPNGDYEFFARTLHNNKSLVTTSLKLSIQNTIQTREQTTNQTTTVALPEPNRFTETTTAVPEPVIAQRTNGVDTTVRRILTDDVVDFEELFRRYALAQQTGDESLIRIAREELVKAREQIYLRMVADQSSRETADSIAVRLQETIDDIKDRVDTFESLRRERTAGESALDSDGDGISDYDEINLYGTDPFSADTDGDGIPDGVEIMRGLDPLVPDTETIVRYESPKELIGLARPDALEIKEVLRVTEDQPEDQPVLVAAEIRGRGLPNSFVTLFIYSTPTVVTVKTDADGSFVYTFDKELEDGRHDVYVAVTDNTGRIIAHSNRFSFIKDAQAFTPVDASVSDVITVTNIVESTNKNAYTTTLGIAVLAFGLILFVLGVSLRRGGGAVHYEAISSDESGGGPVSGGGKVLKNVQFVSQRKEHIDAS